VCWDVWSGRGSAWSVWAGFFFFLGRDGGSRVPIKIDWHVFCCDGCDASVKFWAFLRGEKKT
jgi:hypothetical protein